MLLAGDAAHVHSAAGGQGMNAGILDAMSLATALAKALDGSPEALDTYAAERRPVAQQIVAFADVLTRLATVRPALRPIRNLVLWTPSRLPFFLRHRGCPLVRTRARGLSGSPLLKTRARPLGNAACRR